VRHESHARTRASAAHQTYRHESTFGLGVLVGFLIACPTFLIEESWHGTPLIDQRGSWWVLPASVIAFGLVAGGAVVGIRCRQVWQALLAGALVAAVNAGLIFIVDIVRRRAIGKHLTPGVERLWFYAAIGSIVVGLAGGLIGYRCSDSKGRAAG
jgi:hypothetical protein